MIEIRCAQCHILWKLDDSYAGTRGYCPRCHNVMDIPRVTEADAAVGSRRPETSAKKIPVQCPQCRTLWNVDGAYAGIKGMCPKCYCVLEVPAAEEESAAASALPQQAPANIVIPNMELEAPHDKLPPTPLPESSDLPPLVPLDEELGYDVVEEKKAASQEGHYDELDEIKLVDIEDEIPAVEPVALPAPATAERPPVQLQTARPQEDNLPRPPMEGKKRRSRWWYRRTIANAAVTDLDEGPSLLENIFTKNRCVGLVLMAVGLVFGCFGGAIGRPETSVAAIIQLVTLGVGVIFILVGLYYAITG